MEKLIIKPRVGDEYKIVIDKSTLIAAGGEGGVHINSVHPKTRCVKRLHAPSLQRAEKIQWFVGQDLGLPDRIVVPTEVASTESGEIVGFGMHQLGRRFGVWIWPVSRTGRCGRRFGASFCIHSRGDHYVQAD